MQAAALRVLLALGLFAATLAAAYLLGRSHEATAQAVAQNRQALAYAAEIVRRQGTVDALAADLEAERQKRIPQNRIITREVIRYAQLPADRRCTLDGAWRLLHDAAATGTPADTARVADGSAPAVADAAALDTVAGNYEQCRDTIAQLTGWQQWWRAVQTPARAGE